MADNKLRLSFNSGLFAKESDKKDDKRQKEKTKRRNEFVDKVKKYVCSLLNSREGGQLILTTEDVRITPKLAEDVIRPVEQSFQKVIDAEHISKRMFISQQCSSGTIIYCVHAYRTLCTLNYNLYLPSETQAISISPLDATTVKSILDQNKPREICSDDTPTRFLLHSNSGLRESTAVQFKQLSVVKTKYNNLATRIKNNNFDHYISAFANSNGGRVYCGIRDDGTVGGEKMEQNDKNNVITIVRTCLRNMKWPDHIGDEPKEGVQWTIKFAQIFDQEGQEIDSTYVIVIYIAPCMGGVFCKTPECYHYVVKDGETTVEPLELSTWKRRFFGLEEKDQVTRRMSRFGWSSRKLKRECDTLDGLLLRLINNGDRGEFENEVKIQASKEPSIETHLVLLSKWYVYYYRAGEYDEAEKRLAEFREKSPGVKDSAIFEVRGQLIESALERTRGNHKRSYEIAKEILTLVDQISPCMLTVEHYVHLATVLTIIEGNEDLKKDESLRKALVTGSFKEDAIMFYNTALEQLLETEYVPQSKVDMGQKTRINLAILKLGCSLSGDIIDSKVKTSDIEEAATNLKYVHNMDIEGGSPLSGFRECHLRFAESSLFYRKSHHEADKEKRINLLKGALRKIKGVSVLAIEGRFNELRTYAEKHASNYQEELDKIRH